MHELAIGLAREIHEEVKAIPLVNEYNAQDHMEWREKRMMSERHSMSKGVGIPWMVGKMKRDW